MNFKEKAEKLEKFLEDEFKKSIPLLVLADKSVVYGNYKIKQSKQSNKQTTKQQCHQFLKSLTS